MTYFVEKSNYFRKDNYDIHTDADISISQAFLGGETTIQGLYESIIIEVVKINQKCVSIGPPLQNPLYILRLLLERHLMKYYSSKAEA